jgi:hypothetical protein
VWAFTASTERRTAKPPNTALISTSPFPQEHKSKAALATFATQHAALIKSYNDGVATAQATGLSPAANYAAFTGQQDALVQATRGGLGFMLTPDGLARLHAHVQGEKLYMKISVASPVQ